MNTTLAPSALVTRSDSKGRKFMTIVGDQYDKAGLSEDEAQRVNEASGLSELVSKFIADNRLPNEFVSEEVISRYSYVSGYQKPKSIAQQIKIIHDIFRAVQWGYFRFDEEQIVVPNGAEGLFAIPKWQTMAPTYGDAVARALALLSSTRMGKFENYCEGQLDPQHLKESAKKAEAFAALATGQKDHDILVVPGQFGLRHRGRSVRRARVVMNSLEFGLGAFEVGIMLLTHPERLQYSDDLWIDCAGDEFAPAADGQWSHAPFFNFYISRLRFDGFWFNNASGHYGSASGFLPA